MAMRICWRDMVFWGEAYALPTDVVYYIEGANRLLDAYVREEQRLISMRLARSGKRLVRIGLTAENWKRYLSLRPDVDGGALPLPPTGRVPSALSGTMLYRKTDLWRDADEYTFRCADLHACTPADFEQLLDSFDAPERVYASRFRLLGAERCCMAAEETPPLLDEPIESAPCGAAAPADDERESVQRRFVEELEQALSHLSDEGMNVFLQTLGSDFLKSIAQLAPKPLSPICVDEHFRVWLTDYRMEIRMKALWKAIYILFLRHPEGIVLKQMPEYRAELSEIYYAMGCGEYERMEASLDEVTTPGSDNFRQYLSKINRAFTDVLAIDLAQHYIISGQRGREYRILLPPEKRDIRI